MASIRAIYIIKADNKPQLIFKRTFPTIENRLRKINDPEYISIPKDDTIVWNEFYNKVICKELIENEFKYRTYQEDLFIDNSKMEELINRVDVNIDTNNFYQHSECPIISLKISENISIWPCIYVRKKNMYGLVLPNVDYEKYHKIKNNILKSKLDLSDIDIVSRAKKHYEEQDLSITGSFILIENVLQYILTSKEYKENKLHTYISNMIPFGNINETDINFIQDSLQYLNNKINTNNNYLISNFINEFTNNNDKSENSKTKNPGWVTKLSNNENLLITLNEELKFVKYKPRSNSVYNTILCDISIKSELSKSCEISLPIKQIKNNKILGNIRTHPCSKIDADTVNDGLRIKFIPPHNEFKMVVFEIENSDINKLPIVGTYQLKESSQGEVKVYLTANFDKNAIGKFEYLDIYIPLGHFGRIIDTHLMVQVGEVDIVYNKTTLKWRLQNNVAEERIVLSGTVKYSKIQNNINLKERTDSINSNNSEREYITNTDSSSSVDINNKDMDNKLRSTSDIIGTNCFCKFNYKLTNYILSGIEIDQKQIHFYPKLNPKIEIKRQFIAEDYIVWNELSFNSHELNIPEKSEIYLTKIIMDN